MENIDFNNFAALANIQFDIPHIEWPMVSHMEGIVLVFKELRKPNPFGMFGHP